MSTQPRTPSWKWQDDGDTITGILIGMRWMRQKEEYGGGNIPVLRFQTDNGEYDVWASGRMGTYGDPTGLWGKLASESPRYGDKVTIRRGDLQPFTTKGGEQRSYREWSVNVERQVSTFADLNKPGLPDAGEQAGQATGGDEDIPFAPARV